jgi:hypothetical protein
MIGRLQNITIFIEHPELETIAAGHGKEQFSTRLQPGDDFGNNPSRIGAVFDNHTHDDGIKGAGRVG